MTTTTPRVAVLALNDRPNIVMRPATWLVLCDVEHARSFFAELLGWEYESDEGGYVSIRNAGRLNGGMRKQSERERGTHRTGSRISRSRTPTTRQAERLGGHKLMPATEIHIERFAVIADPQGAAVAVFEGGTDP